MTIPSAHGRGLRSPWVVAVLAVALTCACWSAGAATARASVLPTDIALGRPLCTSATLMASAPDISAPAGFAKTASGTVLWARNADRRRAPASTAKLMTAIVVLRSTTPTEMVRVPAAAVSLYGSKVGLVAGRQYPVRALLEAMLVASGCDAAYSLAVHVSGSEQSFAGLMNNRAAGLGLKNTRYVNATGLDASGAYVSARDLASILDEAMKYEEFRRIARQQSVTVEGKRYSMTNSLAWGYPGYLGGKTGTTTWAGHSVAAKVRRGGVELTSVILGAPDDAARYYDSARLLDWSVLHATPECFASYTTVFDPRNANRVANIRTASTALDGRTIAAGGAVSFNALTGERTAARGYRIADSIVGGRLVPSMGGGVCQVATTMFNSALISGFPIVERKPHSMYIPSYPLGRDATVAWSGANLRFTNDTAKPLTMRSLASSFSVTVGLAGTNRSRQTSISVAPLRMYASMPVRYVVDSSLAPRTSRVLVSGQPGLVTTLGRVIRRSDGSVISKGSFVSAYPPIARVIAVAPR